MLPWHLLPGIIEKLISSNPRKGLECKEPQQKTFKPKIAMVFPLSDILWDSKRARSLSNLVECKVTLPHRSSPGFLYPQSRNRKKVLPWHLLPGIIEKLISSNPCRGLECKEPQQKIFKPKKHKQAISAHERLCVS